MGGALPCGLPVGSRVRVPIYNIIPPTLLTRFSSSKQPSGLIILTGTGPD